LAALERSEASQRRKKTTSFLGVAATTKDYEGAAETEEHECSLSMSLPWSLSASPPLIPSLCVVTLIPDGAPHVANVELERVAVVDLLRAELLC
jgi:hypothetical protein